MRLTQQILKMEKPMIKFLVLMLFAFPALAVEITNVETLQKGDPVWVSKDRTTWQEAKLFQQIELPNCGADFTTQKDGGARYIYLCATEYDTRMQVWISGEVGTSDTINYVTGRDPARKPVTSAEMFGLQDRIKNILFAEDLGSALGTIQALYLDRNRLIEVHEAVREKLKKE